MRAVVVMVLLMVTASSALADPVTWESDSGDFLQIDGDMWRWEILNLDWDDQPFELSTGWSLKTSTDAVSWDTDSIQMAPLGGYEPGWDWNNNQYPLLIWMRPGDDYSLAGRLTLIEGEQFAYVDLWSDRGYVQGFTQVPEPTSLAIGVISMVYLILRWRRNA